MFKTEPQKMYVVFIAILTVGSNLYSALSKQNTPVELQGDYVRSQIRMRFCAGGSGNTCMSSRSYLRNTCCGINSFQCFNDTDHPVCKEADQDYICGYRDAIVCQNKDEKGLCIYSNSTKSIQPLCVCKYDELWPVSENQSSQIRGTCMGNKTTISTTISPMNDQSVSGEVNAVAIVLGAILVIVLLVILVLYLVKRRRNQTPPKKVTTNATNSSDVSSTERAQIQDPLDATEYNYAYDHRPQGNPASDPGKPKPANRYEGNEPSGSSSTTAGNGPETHEVPKYYEPGQSNDDRTGGETPIYYELGQVMNDGTGDKTDDASSPYDHLNNKTGIRSQKVEAPEKEDDDHYASLNV